MLDDMPRLKLEVEGFKRYAMQAILNSSKEVNEIAQAKIDQILSTNKLKELIDQNVDEYVSSAVRSAVANYFTIGEGKFQINDMVSDYLKDIKNGK